MKLIIFKLVENVGAVWRAAAFVSILSLDWFFFFLCCYCENIGPNHCPPNSRTYLDDTHFDIVIFVSLSCCGSCYWVVLFILPSCMERAWHWRALVCLLIHVSEWSVELRIFPFVGREKFYSSCASLSEGWGGFHVYSSICKIFPCPKNDGLWQEVDNMRRIEKSC